MTNVWACTNGSPAGRPGVRFRDAFLGTVAAGALSLALSSPALAGPDACTPSGGGTIETCTGNQAAGITDFGVTPDFTAPPVTTLNVNNLIQAIAPASGMPGITFTSAGAITITSNTGAFGITTANADGIFAVGSGAGAVTVTSTGNITTAGSFAVGIFALSAGAVTVTSTGNITTAGSDANGIFAQGNGAGAVTVTSTGNITTAGNNASGIFACEPGWRCHGDLDRQHQHRGRQRERDFCL